MYVCVCVLGDVCAGMIGFGVSVYHRSVCECVSLGVLCVCITGACVSVCHRSVCECVSLGCV